MKRLFKVSKGQHVIDFFENKAAAKEKRRELNGEHKDKDGDVTENMLTGYRVHRGPDHILGES